MGRGDYDESKIRRLVTTNQIVAFILKNGGMFIGRRWDADGLYFFLSLIMESAVMPERANQCSALNVVIERETVLSISDDGRGLPVEVTHLGQSLPRPKIEYVFSWTWTTNPLPAYYQEFGFFNWQGYVLNAISRQLHIETCFDGQAYELTCGQGEIIQRLRPVGEGGISKGTRLTFTPDPAIFPGFKFDFQILEIKLRELKSNFPAVRFTLEDRVSGQRLEL